PGDALREPLRAPAVSGRLRAAAPLCDLAPPEARSPAPPQRPRRDFQLPVPAHATAAAGPEHEA
ncbi:MAG: hypothetical protein SGPRY_008442, partial [Prymnesium sp.]